MIDYQEAYLKLLREKLTDYKYGNFLYCEPKNIQDLRAGDEVLCTVKEYDSLKRFYGKDWPNQGETMIGLVRLLNLHELVKDIAKNKIEGDFFEAGVWKGGASIYLNALNIAFCDGKKNIWLADSFEGLPKPTLPQDVDFDFTQYNELSIPLKQVIQNFKNYNLLTNNVFFLKGWFKDTLPNATVSNISLLRLDGDLYESTMDILNNLYDKVVSGGYIVVDDYGLECCKLAISDFRNSRGITEEIIEIDWTGAYWIKD
ncbi:TylF/MycF/NovP-related O-methyltransferase [Polaribacter aquimarinus]|uniref:Macrocin O-methyltransferase n=1 Tax=Polaribacter aquimarinus TaxID=2100726 RepID=A0A2U2J7N2_9FLAO|nr:TylF/MycF/NovP-related O-methyltransferase [Polaribacter aquimarinus]PWG04349.1 macrocin O-methyltransferase [Polaribacter aquimarinus]